MKRHRLGARGGILFEMMRGIVVPDPEIFIDDFSKRVFVDVRVDPYVQLSFILYGECKQSVV